MTAENPESPLAKHFEGCLFGIAYGNALGFFCKSSTNTQLKKRLLTEEIKALAGKPDYDYIEAPSSRAIQLCLATSDALIRAKSDSLDDIMDEMTRTYIAWLDTHGPKSSTAQVTKAGIRRLKEGVHWSESGDMHSRGCGATLRTAPIGLYFHDRPEKLEEVARAVCACTHAHPADVASGIVTAHLVARAIQNLTRPMSELLGDAIKFAGTLDASLSKQLRVVENTLRFPKMDLDYAFPGADQHGDSALTMGLYYFMRGNNQNPTHSMLQAATAGDYAKPAAAIAGAINGAYHGTDVLPHGWFPDPHNFDILVELAQQLLAASAASERA